MLKLLIIINNITKYYFMISDHHNDIFTLCLKNIKIKFWIKFVIKIM